MRFTPVNELRRTADDLLDATIDGLIPCRDDITLTRVDVAVNTEEKLVSGLETLVRIERLTGLDVVRELRSHAPSLRRGPDSCDVHPRRRPGPSRLEALDCSANLSGVLRSAPIPTCEFFISLKPLQGPRSASQLRIPQRASSGSSINRDRIAPARQPARNARASRPMVSTMDPMMVTQERTTLLPPGVKFHRRVVGTQTTRKSLA